MNKQQTAFRNVNWWEANIVRVMLKKAAVVRFKSYLRQRLFLTSAISLVVELENYEKYVISCKQTLSRSWLSRPKLSLFSKMVFDETSICV